MVAFAKSELAQGIGLHDSEKTIQPATGTDAPVALPRSARAPSRSRWLDINNCFLSRRSSRRLREARLDYPTSLNICGRRLRNPEPRLGAPKLPRRGLFIWKPRLP